MAELTSKIESTTGASKKAAKSLKGLAAQATATGAAMASMGGAVAAAVGTIGTLGAVLTTATGFTATAAMQAKNFQQAMRGVARTAGLSEDEVGKLSKSLLNLSKTTPRGRIELAKIATEAGRLGIESTDNIRRFTNVVQQMAEVSELTVGRAATELAKISEALGRPISSIRDLADTIDKLSITTPSSTGQITRAMRKMASGMTDQVELSTEAVTALSASLTSLGQEPARAGTRLRRVLNQLTDPSVIKDMSEVMDTMSADEIRNELQKDALPVLKDFLEQVKETGRQGEILNDIFVSSATAALLPLSENMERLENNLQSAGDSMGTVADEFETQLQNLNDQWKMFSGTVGAVMTEVGLEALTPMTESVTQSLDSLQASLDQELADNISVMTEAFGELLGSITAFAGTGTATLFKVVEGLSILTDLDLFGLEGWDINNLVENISGGLDNVRKEFEAFVLDVNHLASETDQTLVDMFTIQGTEQAEKDVRRMRELFEEVGRLDALPTAKEFTDSVRKNVNKMFDKKHDPWTDEDEEELNATKRGEQYATTLIKSMENRLNEEDLSPAEMLVAKQNIRKQLEKSFPNKKAIKTMWESGGAGTVKEHIESIVIEETKDIDLSEAKGGTQEQIAMMMGDIVDVTKSQRSLKESFDKLKPVANQEREGLFKLFKKKAPPTVLEGNKETIKTILNSLESDIEGGWEDVLASVKDNPERKRLLDLLVGLFTDGEKNQAVKQMDISDLFSRLQLKKKLSKQFEGLSSTDIQKKFEKELGTLQSTLRDRVGSDTFDEVLNVSSKFAAGQMTAQQFNEELKGLGKNRQAQNTIRQLANEILNLNVAIDKTTTTVKENFAQSIRTGVQDAGNVMNQEFARLATEGKFSGQRIGDALAGGIVESLNRRLVQQPLTQFLVGSGSDFGVLGSLLGMGGSAYRPYGATASPGMAAAHGFTGRAKGGKLRKGLNIVGERGPEVLASQSKGRVMSNREMREALRSNGDGVEINVINNSNENVDTQQRKQNGKPITDIIIGEVSKDIRQNGQVAQAFSSSFGVQRQGQRM